MAETAALLVDEVLPRVPTCQWVLSLPFALRYLSRPALLRRHDARDLRAQGLHRPRATLGCDYSALAV
jgi:hypothetical protein